MPNNSGDGKINNNNMGDSAEPTVMHDQSSCAAAREAES